jgi:hypothetical protein
MFYCIPNQNKMAIKKVINHWICEDHESPNGYVREVFELEEKQESGLIDHSWKARVLCDDGVVRTFNFCTFVDMAEYLRLPTAPFNNRKSYSVKEV